MSREFNPQLKWPGFHIEERKGRESLFSESIETANEIFREAVTRLKDIDVAGPSQDAFSIIAAKRKEKTNIRRFYDSGVLPEHIDTVDAIRAILNKNEINRISYLKELTSLEQESLSVIVFDKVVENKIENWKKDQTIHTDVHLRRTVVSIRDLLSSLRFDSKETNYPNHTFLENILNLHKNHSKTFEYLGGLSDVLRLQNEANFLHSYFNIEKLVSEIEKKGAPTGLRTEYNRFDNARKGLNVNCTLDLIDDVYFSIDKLRSMLFIRTSMPHRIEFYRKSGHILLDLHYLLKEEHKEEIRKPYELPEGVLVRNLERAWNDNFVWEGKLYSAMELTFAEYENQLLFKTSASVRQSLSTGLKQLKVSVSDYLRSKTPYTFDQFSEQINNLINQIEPIGKDVARHHEEDVVKVFNDLKEKTTAFREYVFYNNTEKK